MFGGWEYFFSTFHVASILYCMYSAFNLNVHVPARWSNELLTHPPPISVGGGTLCPYVYMLVARLDTCTSHYISEHSKSTCSLIPSPSKVSMLGATRALTFQGDCAHTQCVLAPHKEPTVGIKVCVCACMCVRVGMIKCTLYSIYQRRLATHLAPT